MSDEEVAADESDDLNPYYATVIGFVNESGDLVQDSTQQHFNVLINAGSQNDVKVGERVLVFALGPEMIDPDTSESLGHFELVRGYGKVSSVQTKMAVIRSTRTRTIAYQKALSNFNALAIGRATEDAFREDPAPFTNAQLGDLVRFI